MATLLTSLSSDGSATHYQITGDCRGEVEAQMAAVRNTARPARIAFHGPYLKSGRFVAEGTSRDYEELSA